MLFSNKKFTYYATRVLMTFGSHLMRVQQVKVNTSAC